MTMTAVPLIRCHSIPVSFTNWAMRTVSIGVRLPVRISANKNSFQVKSQHRMPSAVIPGTAAGSAILRNAPHLEQPSIMAAYSMSASIPSKKPFMIQEKKQMCTAMWGSIRPR